MKILKLTTLALTTSAILTGCGGSGGSEVPKQPEKTVYSYTENEPLFLEAYQQVDVARVYYASVAGESFEVRTTNGFIDEDSQSEIDDLSYANQELADCAQYTGKLRGAVSDYFGHITPTQENRYEVGGNDAKFIGLMLTDTNRNESVESASFRFTRAYDTPPAFVELQETWNWEGIIDVHQNLGISFLDLHKDTCHIKMDSWEISSTSAL